MTDTKQARTPRNKCLGKRHGYLGTARVYFDRQNNFFEIVLGRRAPGNVAYAPTFEEAMTKAAQLAEASTALAAAGE